MSKSKKKYPYNKKFILKGLQNVFDRIEGEYSNIPECCIEEFIFGTTFHDLKEELEEEDNKDLLKKLKKFHYVPCMSCLENAQPNELKFNGTSDLGSVIQSIMKIIKDKKHGTD